MPQTTLAVWLRAFIRSARRLYEVSQSWNVYQGSMLPTGIGDWPGSHWSSALDSRALESAPWAVVAGYPNRLPTSPSPNLRTHSCREKCNNEDPQDVHRLSMPTPYPVRIATSPIPDHVLSIDPKADTTTRWTHQDRGKHGAILARHDSSMSVSHARIRNHYGTGRDPPPTDWVRHRSYPTEALEGFVPVDPIALARGTAILGQLEKQWPPQIRTLVLASIHQPTMTTRTSLGNKFPDSFALDRSASGQSQTTAFRTVSPTPNTNVRKACISYILEQTPRTRLK